MKRTAWALLVALASGAILAAGAIAWLVGEAALEQWGAIGALAGVLLVPLGVSVFVERLLARWKKAVRAEQLLLALLPIFAAGFVGVMLGGFPRVTRDAFLSVDGHGWWSRRARDLGALLGSGSRSTTPRDPGGPPARPSTTTPEPKPPSPSPPSEPAKLDGFAAGDATYTEQGCDDLAPLRDLEEQYAASNLRATAEQLVKLRYRVGLPFLQAQDDTTLRVWFATGTETFDDVMLGVEAAVHEGSHIWSAKRIRARSITLRINDQVDVEMRRLDTFHRSEIVEHHVDAEADTYLQTYLTGSSGAQGFSTLLDEYNAYVHSLAVRVCTRDYLPSIRTVSARDGILTMMYYVEVYLWLARTSHADDYRAILADAGQRKVITLVWDRAEYWLRKSADRPGLGIRDEAIERWVYTPQRLAEIQRVRDHR